MADFNLTQCIGLASFGLATITYSNAARQNSACDEPNRRCWLILSALYAILFLELIANTRHSALRKIGLILGLGDQYEYRRPLQLFIIVVTTIIVLCLIAKLYKVILDLPLVGLSLLIAAFSVILFFIEIISLHQLDAILYARIGTIMVIGCFWLVLGLTASAIALANIPTPSKRIE